MLLNIWSIHHKRFHQRRTESIICSGQTWGSETAWKKGEAVWKTPSQPSIAESKEPSSRRLALNRWSLSAAPSNASKWAVLIGSAMGQKTNRFTIKTKRRKFCYPTQKIPSGVVNFDMHSFGKRNIWLKEVKWREIKQTRISNTGFDGVTSLEKEFNDPRSYISRATGDTHSLRCSAAHSLLLPWFWITLSLRFKVIEVVKSLEFYL